MKQEQKGFSHILVLLFLVTLGVLGATGWYVYSYGRSSSRSGISNEEVVGKPGVNIEVITGAGGMPPGESQGKVLTGEMFTVVFTEPFSSLENWQVAKSVSEVSTTSGRASLDLPAGKYGVYYVYKGQKTLYGDLTLENPRNDVQRDKQGPWYVEVKNLQRLQLRFSVNSLPV